MAEPTPVETGKPAEAWKNQLMQNAQEKDEPESKSRDKVTFTTATLPE